VQHLHRRKAEAAIALSTDRGRGPAGGLEETVCQKLKLKQVQAKLDEERCVSDSCYILHYAA
jgi:hypothetical protein